MITKKLTTFDFVARFGEIDCEVAVLAMSEIELLYVCTHMRIHLHTHVCECNAKKEVFFLLSLFFIDSTHSESIINRFEKSIIFHLNFPRRIFRWYPWRRKKYSIAKIALFTGRPLIGTYLTVQKYPAPKEHPSVFCNICNICSAKYWEWVVCC